MADEDIVPPVPGKKCRQLSPDFGEPIRQNYFSFQSANTYYLWLYKLVLYFSE